MKAPILCVGEVLWDAMPAGLFLGGAPHNVARHLHRLGQPVVLASRVGDDVLGHEARRRLDADGLDTDLVQIDPNLPTGFVRVAVDANGLPEYEIVQPAAWDAIALTEDLREAATEAQAVVFGSLAQRDEPSRRTVQALAAAAPFAVFDVNLRPPFVDRDVVRASLEIADCVKLNEDELDALRRWFGGGRSIRTSVEALAESFGCRIVCVTRSERGAALWHEGRWHEHPGYPVTTRDTVGAGDAFLAALLAGVLTDHKDEVALDLACRLGAFVASRSGAVPDYTTDALDEVLDLSG